MFDHLSVGVRDLAAARRFYDAFFAPLGSANTFAGEAELAYGPGDLRQFYLYPVTGAQVQGLGSHIAFTARSRAAVDAAYGAAIANGASTLRAAGPHPDIAPDYYGAVLLDPDGNKLEIVLGTMHQPLQAASSTRMISLSRSSHRIATPAARSVRSPR